MNKFIFLDVDGVLNSEEYFVSMYEGRAAYDPGVYEAKIDLLKELVDKTDAKIIVSSSWRRLPNHLEYLKKRLANKGIQIFDVTPFLYNKPRGDEISKWFKDNNIQTSECSYIIFDDDSDMTVHKKQLIKTSWKTGLKRKDIERAEQILNSKGDNDEGI